MTLTSKTIFFKARISKHICLHISEVSAVMVGICQSGVGLIHVTTIVTKIDTYVDDCLALDSLVFLLSCLTAYWAFRSPSTRRTLQIERVADSFFVIGLCVMVIVALLTSYSSIKQ
jgi:hypothetical protein